MDDPRIVVTEALQRGDHATALRTALDVWRECRAPVVADLIDAIDAAAPFDGPREQHDEAFQAAWLAVAETESSPFATGWLAKTFTTNVKIFGPGIWVDPNEAAVTYVALRERVRRLRARGPDPRVARALTTMVNEALYAVGDDENAVALYTPVLDAIVAQGDVRQLPRLRASSVHEALRGVLSSRIRRLRGRSTRDLPDAVAWAALTDTLVGPGPAPYEAQLLLRVHAEPENDDARRVYADALQDRGDPHGELIALQLVPRSDRTPDMDRRIETLIREHRDSWLGDDLRRVLAKANFARGFLDDIQLTSEAFAPADVWARACEDPRLATVSRIVRGMCSDERFVAFVTSPAMSGLRHLAVAEGRTLELLSRVNQPTPIRRIEVRSLGRKLCRAIARTKVFANADTLVIRASEALPAMLDALVSSPLVERLRTLELAPPTTATDAIEPFFRAWSVLPTTIERLTYVSYDAEMTLERTPSGVVLRCAGAAEPMIPLVRRAVPDVVVDGQPSAGQAM